VNNTEDVWCYQDGLSDYLTEAVNGFETLPEKPFVGEFKGSTEAVSWALLWLPEGGELKLDSNGTRRNTRKWSSSRFAQCHD